MFLSWLASFFLISSMSSFKLRLSVNIGRIFTKTSIILMRICVARPLFKTLANCNIPCSVNTYGSEPPRCCLEGIAFCDTMTSTSSVLVQDKKMVYRLEEIQKVNPADKDRILYILDVMIKDAQNNTLQQKLA